MGQAYDIKLKVEQVIKDKNLNEHEVKGTIGLYSGIMFAFIRSDTPDNKDKLIKLRAAVKKVLCIDV